MAIAAAPRGQVFIQCRARASRLTSANDHMWARAMARSRTLPIESLSNDFYDAPIVTKGGAAVYSPRNICHAECAA